MKSLLWKTLAIGALLSSTAIYADAPAAMQIVNLSHYTTNAYVHNNPGQPLLPSGVTSIPWYVVTGLCHGNLSRLKDEDPCSFEIYATTDSSNPKQIDVGTVTFYVSSGQLVNYHDVEGSAYGLKLSSNVPGQFVLSGSCA